MPSYKNLYENKVMDPSKKQSFAKKNSHLRPVRLPKMAKNVLSGFLLFKPFQPPN